MYTGIEAAGVSSTPSITSPSVACEGRLTTRPKAPSSSWAIISTTER
jgi:hypothetical protein